MSIYVLRSDNLVKIGFSEKIRSRVQAIISAVPVPVEFVGYMPGGRDLEKHLHETFSDTRFSGEWFVETAAMKAVFETILIARLPRSERPEQIKRAAEKTSTQELSSKVKETAISSWPGMSRAEMIQKLASDLGWSGTRARDFYYADPRIALRAYELVEVQNWLEQMTAGDARSLAYRIAPEIKDED